MLFRDKLYDILEDLSKHKHTKSEAMSIHIQNRLDIALKSYLESINESFEYLSQRDEFNILKKMNRMKP